MARWKPSNNSSTQSTEIKIYKTSYYVVKEKHLSFPSPEWCPMFVLRFSDLFNGCSERSIVYQSTWAIPEHEIMV